MGSLKVALSGYLIGAFGLIGLSLLPGPGRAETERPSDEVVACVARNIPQADELRSVTLVTRDRAGTESTTRARLFGRRTSPHVRRLLVSFSEPEELAGSALLVIEEQGGLEVWIHTPELGGKRIELDGAEAPSLFGAGLSHEDVMHLLGFIRTEATNLKRLADAHLAGRPVYVLESTPAPGTSPYERIESAIDQETCVPLEVKFYEQVGQVPRKVMTASPGQVFRVRSIWIAHAATLLDTRDERRTMLYVESVLPDLALPDAVFDPEGLGRYKPVVDIDVHFDPVEPELE